MDEQIPQEPVIGDSNPPASRPAWILWLALGGLVIFLCAVVFIVTLIFVGPKFVQKFFPSPIQTAAQTTRTATQSNTMGNPDAPVHIIEYGDFQCPYCLKFWRESEPQLIKEYVNTGKVYFEFRSVGAFIGPESGWAAEAAYCAGDQNKFWEYHDILFSNWTGENVGDFSKDKLVKYAETIHLDTTTFEKCLSEEKHKATVDQDAAKAEADGVHATPTLFINGYKEEGAQPYEFLKHVIEEILKGNQPDSQSG